MAYDAPDAPGADDLLGRAEKSAEQGSAEQEPAGEESTEDGDG